MANYTVVRVTKVQPYLHVVDSGYAALAHVDSFYAPTLEAGLLDFHANGTATHANLTAERVLVLIGEENYSYRSTSTIVLMVSAWILLILGFVFCCCAECCGVSVWRGKKTRSSIDIDGLNQAEQGGNGNGSASARDATADRANHSDPTIEICRRCPPDYEAESLPSYTIVSGLPTYDDALEEFRKAGIILTPAMVPIIKIFECNETGKEQAVGYSLVETNIASADAAADNVSLASTTCNCGNSSPTSSLPSYSAATAAVMAAAAAAPPQVIELSPEHLASLSQKRLSLQISFNNSVRRQSPLRNHLLRSRAVGNTAGVGPSEAAGPAIHGSGAHGVHGGGGATILPVLHRSSSTISLSNERQLLDQRLRHLHHRGSLY
uniref:Comm3, isoform C n=1 Tax=Drosophila melanogaster TaxID=7227 RepID=Q9VUS2_DROME|nr:comm3, isoform C [Drosophila melanogaster]AAF49603.3 comm3, isoform C [Drosophila melanogaster]ABC86470.1 IP04049p [Drosophila melanogaster]AOQ11891.1 comm3-RC [synthetic construct]|eukprot:NP_648791.2 comm3, isoform C [Drosophila melanogaster]